MTNGTPSIQSGKPDAKRPVFHGKVLSVKEKTARPKADLEEVSLLISKIYVDLVHRGH
jgi:hypothetical protein